MRAAWLLAACLSAACAPARQQLRPATPKPSVPIEPAPAPAHGATAAPPSQRLIYEDRWPGLDAMLLGVDEAHGRAYLKLRARGDAGPSRYLIDTIDIESGARVDRWEARPERAALLASYDGRFLPLDAEPGADLARLGAMIAGWSARTSREGSAWPVADASPDGARVIFTRAPENGSDGDWLFLHDVAKGTSTRIDRGVVASYDAKFSPDGAALAWRGCVGHHPCRYQLYVSSVSDAARGRIPRPIPGIAEPQGPLWTADGSALYVLSAPPARPACLFRVDPQTRTASQEVCGPQLAGFALDPAGDSLIYAERTRAAEHVTIELSWKRLHPTQTAIPHRLQDSSDFSLGPDGLSLVDGPDGLLALDLASGGETLIALHDDAFVFVPSTHWPAHGSGKALVLAKSFARESIALVELDVAAELAR